MYLIFFIVASSAFSQCFSSPQIRFNLLCLHFIRCWRAKASTLSLKTLKLDCLCLSFWIRKNNSKMDDQMVSNSYWCSYCEMIWAIYEKVSAPKYHVCDLCSRPLRRKYLILLDLIVLQKYFCHNKNSNLVYIVAKVLTEVKWNRIKSNWSTNATMFNGCNDFICQRKHQ